MIKVQHSKRHSQEHIPPKGSVVTFSMLPAEPNGRPGADDVFGNKDLMLFMRAKKVRCLSYDK